MKKIINDPFAVVDEMLEGIVLAHGAKLRLIGDDKRAVVRADAPVAGKVAIVTGGGSGHLPVFMGYVGRGLVDGCSIGNVFSSPTVDQMVAATREVNAGAGVLYLFGNYGGDVMNFGMAAETVEMDDIHVETVLASDDVASAPKGSEARRRGVAGIFFLYKLAGAKAEQKPTLAEVKGFGFTARTSANSRLPWRWPAAPSACSSLTRSSKNSLMPRPIRPFSARRNHAGDDHGRRLSGNLRANGRRPGGRQGLTERARRGDWRRRPGCDHDDRLPGRPRRP